MATETGARAAALNESWCIDADTRHSVVARRNVLAALWAGRLIGKSGDDLVQYAREVHTSDFEVPGDSDVVAKLSADLSAAGFEREASDVRGRLANFQRQAWRECGATD